VRNRRCGRGRRLFASEIKALLPAIEREVDRSALFDFFVAPRIDATDLRTGSCARRLV